MPLPRKRLGLDVYADKVGDEPVVVMRDPEGLFEEAHVLRLLGALVWDLLDGKRDARDVQGYLMRHTRGTRIPEEAIERIIVQLDELHLLEGTRLNARRERVIDEYRRMESRPARFVGRGYADTAQALEQELEVYYEGDFGAGKPGASTSGRVRGVIAPHIDFARGGACYTHAYRRIAEAPPADIYVILGVAHVSPEPPFVPTLKSYATPMGEVPIHRELLDTLLRKTKRAGLDHEIVHRMEHSAEFQAVFLRHARRAKPEFSIVPILCSAFERHCGERSPREAPVVEEYIVALAESIRECGQTVCVIAGVDFAHVGPRFGDRVDVNEDLINRMTEGDKKSLAQITVGNAEGFWGSVMDEGNWRKVCGLSATYTAMRLLEGTKAELLRYTYAPDPAGGIVSFAAAVFG